MLSAMFALTGSAQNTDLYQSFVIRRRHRAHAYGGIGWTVTWQKTEYKDILWMHRAGIGGFHAFDRHGDAAIVKKRLIYMDADGKTHSVIPPISPTRSAWRWQWLAPGWSCTGGPWVKPEDAMKKLTWRRLIVTGGKTLHVMLPAYETTGSSKMCRHRRVWRHSLPHPPMTNITKTSPSSPCGSVRKRRPCARWAPRWRQRRQIHHGPTHQWEPHDTVALPCDSVQRLCVDTISVQEAADHQGAMRGWRECAQRMEACATAAITKHLEVSDDGKTFHRICDILTAEPLSRPSTSPGRLPDISASSSTTRCDRYVRRPLWHQSPEIHKKNWCFILLPKSIMPKRRRVCLPTWHDEQYDARWKQYHTCIRRGGSTSMVDEVQAISHGGHPKANGASIGFGFSLTGKKNHPASPGSHRTGGGTSSTPMPWKPIWNITSICTRMPRRTRGQARTAISAHRQLWSRWETWTAKMAQEFESRRGYSLLKWLPVLHRSDYRKHGEERTVSLGLAQDHRRTDCRQYVWRDIESGERPRYEKLISSRTKTDVCISSTAWRRRRKPTCRWRRYGVGKCRRRQSYDVRMRHPRVCIRGSYLRAEPGGRRSFTSNGLGNRAYIFYPGNLETRCRPGDGVRTQPFCHPWIGSSARGRQRNPDWDCSSSDSGLTAMRRGRNRPRRDGLSLAQFLYAATRSLCRRYPILLWWRQLHHRSLLPSSARHPRWL